MSQEGTTQGDPLAMPWYSVNTSIMIQSLRLNIPEVKQVWLADDSAGGGRLINLYSWLKHLEEEGKKFGYLVNGPKCWLIVKSQELAEEARQIFGKEVNITTEGKRHLGAVIGSKDYQDEYCGDKVQRWRQEIIFLAEIAKSQPHAVYIALTKAYKFKFTYFMRTIEAFEDYTDPIPVQEALNEILLPQLFGQEEPLSDELFELVTLTPAQGGLGVPNLKVEAPLQYAASKLFTKHHVESIKCQSVKMRPSEQSTDDLKRTQQTIKIETVKSRMDSVDASLSPEVLCLVMQSRDKGASSWLNAIPLKDQSLTLNKQEFRDSLRMRYNLPLHDLPSFCACGDRFNINHAPTCKKGGFVAQRHDGVRNLLTSLLGKVCKNVEIEPHLLLLDNERLDLRSANTSPEARLDMKADGFWLRGAAAFFDVRVTHVNSKCNQGRPTRMVFKEHENEKKKCQKRVLDAEMGTFTPLVFGTNGGLGSDCQMFLKQLAGKLAEKDQERYAVVITWLRTRISFEILRVVHVSVRGTRSPFHRKQSEVVGDFSLNVKAAGIF